MTYTKYTKTLLDANKWVITFKGKDYKKPTPNACYTSAFDTETLVLLDGKVVSQAELLKRLRNVKTEEKRKRVTNITWAWMFYDEVNGFFMSNDFEIWLLYSCLCSYKYSYCYNATFDFAQIDYEVIANGRDKWKRHVGTEEGKAYNKHQPYTYESLHNGTGVRYSYKLWYEYRNKDRHKYVHALELHDFMKLCGGGLKRVLEDLKVKDNEGNDIRKLSMEYQSVDPNNLTEEEVDYCLNDVKGLYFAVKNFNETIEKETANELHCYGKKGVILTSGGLAKRELLHNLYEDVEPFYRLKLFQREHPITEKQDKYVRAYHLYRGGITFLNPRYKGKLVTNKRMYRYDVNSEYPYAMARVHDLVGKPFRLTLDEWDAKSEKYKKEHEAIYIMEKIYGKVRPNMLPIWYDPIQHDFTPIIDIEDKYLIFEREIEELIHWYDFTYTCTDVIVVKRGGKNYKDFVEENYKRKAYAKKIKNKTIEQVTKLKLNSSYGKLAERVERVEGHYELNEETGAIHFVEDGVKVDTSASMNVIIGSLVTCEARITLLRYIRDVCKPNVSKNFVYCDTDSVHAFAKYKKCDPYKLGALKNETPNGCMAVKYIAPKTYVDVLKIGRNKLINLRDIEVHSKGVSIASIIAELQKKAKKKVKTKDGYDYFVNIKQIDEAIAYGKKYTILCAMNVRGGKVLLPTEKYIARNELADDEEGMYGSNGSGVYLNER